MKKFLLLGLFLAAMVLALASFQGLAKSNEFDSILIDFREDIPQAEVDRELDAIANRYDVSPRLNSEFSGQDRVYIIEGDREILEQIRRELKEETEYVEPNYIYQNFGTPNDPDYVKQWNLRSLNVERAWEDTRGNGIVVAVIDTGISRVPDLNETKFVKGYDFVNDRVEATDDNGHGTHVAGTIAQTTNNRYGVAGVAYQASLMPLKVLSAGGSGTVADIAEAIKFAANKGAKVINMSLGGGGESQAMKEAINFAHDKGVVIVAAAGNANRNAAAYPARYPHVIGVSATDAAGMKAPYSNYGAGVDIAAPGGDTSKGVAGGILQNTIQRDRETGTLRPAFLALQGTSMASPHVAGVAALVASTGVNDPDEVLKVLKASARQVKDDSLNHYGAGHLDAAGAVQAALKGKISFRDFFRWLRDSGYLNPRFWIDGGVVALLPKLAMVIGSYLLAWLLRNLFPFGWSWFLSSGLVAGSSGLFFLRGFYIFDLPQWPFRVVGSSIPELGNAIQGTPALNPLFASVLIPLGLVVLLLGNRQWKWFAVGTALGVASCLAVSAVVSPALWGLGSAIAARIFLGVNAVLCVALAVLASQGEKQLA